jgi:hypothetical protein
MNITADSDVPWGAIGIELSVCNESELDSADYRDEPLSRWRSLEITSCVYARKLKRQEDGARVWRLNDRNDLCLSKDHFMWQEKREVDRALIVPMKCGSINAWRKGG